MSDQRPEIEKWLPSEGMDSTTDFPHLGAARIDEPAYVLYSDHIRHLTMAQIAVLEEIWEEMPSEDFEEDEPLYRKDMVFLKIDALRKELKQ